MLNASVLLHASLVVAFCTACGGDPLEQVDPATVPESPTWEDVRPIMDRYCQGCHASETLGGAPDGYDFAGYDLTVCEWEEVDEVLRERSMPPGGSQRLAARDEAILYRWVGTGFPSADGSRANCADRGGRDE